MANSDGVNENCEQLTAETPQSPHGVSAKCVFEPALFCHQLCISMLGHEFKRRLAGDMELVPCSSQFFYACGFGNA